MGVGQPDDPLLLGRQDCFFSCLVDRGDPGKEPLVLRDLVAAGGELGRHRAFDLLHGVVTEGRPIDAVDRLHAVEHPAGAFHRENRVVKRGRGGIGGDPVDRRELVGHPGLERRPEVGHPRRIERRHAAVGAGPDCSQRVQVAGRRRGGHVRHVRTAPARRASNRDRLACPQGRPPRRAPRWRSSHGWWRGH